MRRTLCTHAACFTLGAILAVAGMLRYGAPAGSALMNLGARVAAAGSDARVLTPEEVETTVAEVAAKYVPPQAKRR